jgi:predicted nucleotidyltransferase
MTDNTASTGKHLSGELEGLMGKDDVLRLLSRSGFDVAAAATRFLGDLDIVGALLVGSVAEGYQTASSDVDILFLTYAAREKVDTSSTLIIESGASRETLTYTAGVEINTEIVCREDRAALADSLGLMVHTLASNGQFSTLPMIDNYSLRFLHRLRTGIPLFGEEVIEKFQNDFQVHALPLYLSIKYLVLARESIEDATAASVNTPGLVEFICRDILEHCLLALAATAEFTSQSRRFVMNWIETLPDDAPHATTLRDIRDRLLNRSIVPAEQKSQLVEECTRCFQDVLAAFGEDPVRRAVVDQIFATISYAE